MAAVETLKAIPWWREPTKDPVASFHQQGQSLSVVPGWDIHIHGAHRRIRRKRGQSPPN